MAEGQLGTGQASRDEASLQEELEEIFEKRQSRRQTIKFVVLGIAGLTGLVAAVRTISFPTRAPDPLAVGNQVTISMASMLAVDDDALSAMNDLQQVDDQVGLNMLLRDGRAFMLNEGTDILIIDSRFNMVRVRALEGPNSGMTGWVQAGRVR